jgi:hypothetical protein
MRASSERRAAGPKILARSRQVRAARSRRKDFADISPSYPKPLFHAAPTLGDVSIDLSTTSEVPTDRHSVHLLWGTFLEQQIPVRKCVGRSLGAKNCYFPATCCKATEIAVRMLAAVLDHLRRSATKHSGHQCYASYTDRRLVSGLPGSHLRALRSNGCKREPAPSSQCRSVLYWHPSAQQRLFSPQIPSPLPHLPPKPCQ